MNANTETKQYMDFFWKEFVADLQSNQSFVELDRMMKESEGLYPSRDGLSYSEYWGLFQCNESLSDNEEMTDASDITAVYEGYDQSNMLHEELLTCSSSTVHIVSDIDDDDSETNLSAIVLGDDDEFPCTRGLLTRYNRIL